MVVTLYDEDDLSGKFLTIGPERELWLDFVPFHEEAARKVAKNMKLKDGDTRWNDKVKTIR